MRAFLILLRRYRPRHVINPWIYHSPCPAGIRHHPCLIDYLLKSAGPLHIYAHLFPLTPTAVMVYNPEPPRVILIIGKNKTLFAARVSCSPDPHIYTYAYILLY